MGRRPQDPRSGADHYNGTRLTGLHLLRGWIPTRNGCVITAAGPSMREFSAVSYCQAARGNLTTVALAGGIRAWMKAGIRPDLWIVTDTPIVQEYRHLIASGQVIAAGRQAAQELTRNPIPGTTVSTFNTMNEPRHYPNEYQVYSRGTCAIAAMMVMRFLEVRVQYVLGMDCARTAELYHYDGRKHPVRSEQTPTGYRVFTDGCWSTSHIDRMRLKLDEAARAGLFEDLEVTTVGHTHQPVKAFRNVTYPEFYTELEARYARIPRPLPERDSRALPEAAPKGAVVDT